ncbi:MAG: flagellin [Clostridia bacterium]|nr:flagellin [Clostridia bacterium]
MSSKSLEKLSSGYRINRAGDDAAGLAISEKMRGQIRGLDQAVRNAQDGISLIQTAEGALNETHSILQRMRELATQAANDTNTLEDRIQIQKEINQLTEEIDRIGITTEFNTQRLLDGSYSGSLQIGANEGQEIGLAIGDMRAIKISGGTFVADGLQVANSGAKWMAVDSNGSLQSGVGSGSGLNVVKLHYVAADGSITEKKGAAISVLTQSGASAAITTFNNAIEKVSTERSKLGAVQNRLEHTINNLSVASENLTAAESRIRDVDMAKEMMAFAKNNIISQAATAMLAQANQQPQQVLSLLR